MKIGLLVLGFILSVLMFFLFLSVAYHFYQSSEYFGSLYALVVSFLPFLSSVICVGYIVYYQRLGI